MNEEAGFRDDVQAVAGAIETAIGKFFPSGALRMGGGTVLEARWGHRHSTDIDLFCSPTVYSSARRQHGQAMEEGLRDISSDPVAAMVDLRISSVMVQGVEVSLMAEDPLIGDRTHKVVPGTTIETWSSADILAGKLFYPLSQSQIVEPRDLYDLAAAAHHEPHALQAVANTLGKLHHDRIRTLFSLLPEHWEENSRKPLLGLPEEPFDYAPAEILALLSRFSCPIPKNADESDNTVTDQTLNQHYGP